MSSNPFHIKPRYIFHNHPLLIGDRIREAREEAEMSKAELARICGISRAAVSQWEAGRTNPTIKNLATVARVTRKPLDFFAKGIG